jgi:hypothetical protein
MGTSKLIESSAAFLFEVPGSNSPLVVQELQIGGSRLRLPSITGYPMAALTERPAANKSMTYPVVI